MLDDSGKKSFLRHEHDVVFEKEEPLKLPEQGVTAFLGPDAAATSCGWRTFLACVGGALIILVGAGLYYVIPTAITLMHNIGGNRNSSNTTSAVDHPTFRMLPTGKLVEQKGLNSLEADANSGFHFLMSTGDGTTTTSANITARLGRVFRAVGPDFSGNEDVRALTPADLEGTAAMQDGSEAQGAVGDERLLWIDRYELGDGLPPFHWLHIGRSFSVFNREGVFFQKRFEKPLQAVSSLHKGCDKMFAPGCVNGCNDGYTSIKQVLDGTGTTNPPPTPACLQARSKRFTRPNFFSKSSKAYTKAWREFVKPGSAAIDIGANVGDTTLPMAILTGPKGKTVGIEALSKTARICAAQLGVNRLNTENAGYPKLHRLAVSATKDSGTMAMNVDCGGCNAGPQKTELWQGTKEEVPQRRLDNFIRDEYGEDFWKTVSFVKIDTEGYDKFLVRNLAGTVEGGAGTPLFKIHKPTLWVEWFDPYKKVPDGHEKDPVELNKVSQGSAELFAAIHSAGYKAYNPETRAEIKEGKNGEGVFDLLLLPA